MNKERVTAMVFVNANETHLFNSYCTRKMSSAFKKLKFFLYHINIRKVHSRVLIFF